jgi:hypothetical protein
MQAELGALWDIFSTATHFSYLEKIKQRVGTIGGELQTTQGTA